jgi:hypothetical protein
MRYSAEALKDVKRLQKALEAVSADLDAIEQRPHFSLRSAADRLAHERSRGIERFVGHFAAAVNKGHRSS